MKKLWATAAVAVSIIGATAAAASPALAIGDDQGTTSFSGNGAKQAFGNSSTHGDLSPQLGLVQGSLNKPCIGMPTKTSTASLVGATPIALQDVNVLASPQNQQCTENSTQAKGDEALSHILDDIPVLSGNGVGNR
ncbi:rodlin [Streptomyces sp. NPDC058280]|uniref:rodlin n=1 Tax=Streptomyces sp. NPDC058280 TaxID=3346419 RepID=UPI0036ED2BB2